MLYGKFSEQLREQEPVFINLFTVIFSQLHHISSFCHLVHEWWLSSFLRYRRKRVKNTAKSDII